jgi:sensor histidine kinase regulating citrate/malate metabolism
MHGPHAGHTAVTFGTTLLTVASLMAVAPSLACAQAKEPAEQTAKIFAQTLVEAAQARHPEADEIGILATTDKGCRGIASTDKSDIGEECEAEDIQPMKTGRTSVEKEGSGFDVSVLLHDTTGKTIGVLAVGFKGAPGRTEATVTEIAKKMEAEMAAQIPVKEKLFEPAK